MGRGGSGVFPVWFPPPGRSVSHAQPGMCSQHHRAPMLLICLLCFFKEHRERQKGGWWGRGDGGRSGGHKGRAGPGTASPEDARQGCAESSSHHRCFWSHAAGQEMLPPSHRPPVGHHSPWTMSWGCPQDGDTGQGPSTNPLPGAGRRAPLIPVTQPPRAAPSASTESLSAAPPASSALLFLSRPLPHPNTAPFFGCFGAGAALQLAGALPDLRQAEMPLAPAAPPSRC